MSCATHAELAASDVDARHVDSCLACRREAEAQRAVRARLAGLPAPALTDTRRAALAAEVMARIDLREDVAHARLSATRNRVRFVAVAGALAAAAATLVLVMRDERTLGSKLASRTPAIVQATPAPAPRPSPIPHAPAPVVRDEAPPVAPVVVQPEPPAKRLDRARQVFGATTADQQQATVERDTLVEASPLAAFRIGWEALRAQRYADAIAAFDRATDPVVAEDAAFWAAIAAQRAGDIGDARKRLDEFLSRFPDSPRADDARTAREVLR